MRPEDHKPGKLAPIADPVALKEATVRDYRRDYGRIGVPLSARALERLAVRDLELVDAYERGIDKSPRPKTPPKKKAPLIVTPEQAADEQLRPVLPEAQRERPVSLAEFTGASSRWPFAMGRIRRILEGATVHRDPIVMAMTATHPECALRVLRLFHDYKLRYRESRHNPFRGLGRIDAIRKLVRMVEDICDASAGQMGPWWVPK